MSFRFIYFDTETTGIKTDTDKIIEIAFFDPERNKEKTWFINPEKPIPKEATAVHQITDEMVKNAPIFKEVAKEILDFLEGDIALVAHNNLAFDKPIFLSEFQRANLKVPEFMYIDTLLWARKYRSDLPRHTLQYLREIYNVAENQAHRALDDVKTLYQVFSKMIDDLSCSTVIELLKKRNCKTMPFGKHQGKPLQDVPKDYIQWLKKSEAFARPDNQNLLEEFTKLNLI